MVQQKKLGVKPKKKWFGVLAPEIFNSTEISEVTAFEPENLIGRPVELNLMQITGNPKDQQKKLILKIIGTKGEKAITEPWRYLLVESFIQRTARRYKTRVTLVYSIKTADDKTARIKLFVLIVKDIHQRVRASMIKKIEELIREKVSKTKAHELFMPATIDKISNEIKKEIRKIYPADKFLICKLSLV